MNYNDLILKYGFDAEMIIEGYTVEEAAKQLGVHWQTILNCIKRGELEAVKMGRGYRITQEAIEKFVESRTSHKKDKK